MILDCTANNSKFRCKDAFYNHSDSSQSNEWMTKIKKKSDPKVCKSVVNSMSQLRQRWKLFVMCSSVSQIHLPFWNTKLTQHTSLYHINYRCTEKINFFHKTRHTEETTNKKMLLKLLYLSTSSTMQRLTQCYQQPTAKCVTFINRICRAKGSKSLSRNFASCYYAVTF
jgi:hypothetical protein